MLDLCPECHMPVSDQAEECPHCGYKFRSQSGGPAEAKTPGRVCDYCKMENPGDVMFCVSCGAPIKVAKAAPAQSGPDSAAQPINGSYSQQSPEVKIKYEKTESTFSFRNGAGAAAAAIRPDAGTITGRGTVRRQQQPQKPPVQLTPRAVFSFILLAAQWGICLILVLFAVVLGTELSAGAVGLTGAALLACPLIKKLPFRIHPALRALAVFVLFLVGVFMG